MNDNIILILSIIIAGAIGAYIGITIIKLKNKGLIDLFNERIGQKDKDIALKEAEKIKEIDKHLNKIEVLDTKLLDFENIKNEKLIIEVELKRIKEESNDLKTQNTTYKNSEEGRIKEYQKKIETSNTLIDSLEKEKSRLSDERVSQEKERFEALNTYVEQNDFPYPGGKPDNTIEILDQYIIFDAKSPANEDLSNFPKYIRTQTENLKKYTKHEGVKNDIFLVIPSNTLSVIKEFTFNIGDYNVYVISKDSLEPIILSLKKIEEYEFADKLSPEERDDICRVIGKFAHTSKRKIQIEMYFMEEFLDILHKSKTLLPKEILKRVIEFENAVKLNPPMEKRKKQILTNDLIEQTNKIKNKIKLEEIPKIEANVAFKEDNLKEDNINS